jgi:DNA-binding CsgD family transcriptional regulator
LKKVREVPKLIPSNVKRSNLNQPDFFAFCEKSTGAVQFRTEPSADLNYTVERMAGLLAMQCLVRGSDPEDFDVLIAAEQAFAKQLLSRAKELLEQGRAVASPASLSPRQREILQSVIRNRANKEIASKLNITVRTVKFHVSSLLNRFGVQNRTELARRAATFMPPALMNREEAEEDSGLQALGPVAVTSPLHIAAKERSAQFQRRVLSA